MLSNPVNAKEKFPHDMFKYPLIRGYTMAFIDNVARTKMAGGVARQRRRFTSVPTTVQASFTLVDDMYEFFRAWYVHKINYGADYFLMNLKIGKDCKEQIVRFTKPYTSNLISDRHFDVNVTLEILKIHVIDEDDLITCSSADEAYIDAVNKLKKLVFEDWGKKYYA
ncbi:hypothetical protein AB832_07140 [Flavobacteriaceae bacterium (ex Bugula neritina AB1)]|nr:hypothetical protein AB832_07140 [Flavobacteriaceae bacterium (ex Bugula neritina AB1)]